MAVKEYVKGIRPNDIFIMAGFDMEVLGNETARQCLIRWMNRIKKEGLDSLKTEQRGVKKSKVEIMIESEELKRLRLELEYVKEERDFFAKLRAEGK
jgi:transposase